jgi:hypothetical protein
MMQQLARNVARDVAMNLAWPMDGKTSGLPAPPSDIPANAIYANGEPIPDPAGGYLRYGDTVA